MNRFSFTQVTTLLSVFLLTGSVYAAKTPVLRDGSIDEGARIMKVHCPSGKRTTIRMYFRDYDVYRKGQTCVYKKDGSDICRANWDHDAAALEACKQM